IDGIVARRIRHRRIGSRSRAVHIIPNVVVSVGRDLAGGHLRVKVIAKLPGPTDRPSGGKSCTCELAIGGWSVGEVVLPAVRKCDLRNHRVASGSDIGAELDTIAKVSARI